MNRTYFSLRKAIFILDNISLALILMALLSPDIANSENQEYQSKVGVWSGTIDNLPIMLCIESSEAKYYYAGHSKEINLNADTKGWTETANEKVTGYWRLQGTQTNYIFGSWRNSSSTQSAIIAAQRVNQDPEACSNSLYQQALLIPGESRLSLPLPSPQTQVAASGSCCGDPGLAAVVKDNGELWMWGDKLSAPKLIGTGYAKVAISRGHTAAIKRDRSLWGWGSNATGQLGGETVTGDAPVHMGDDFVDVAATGNSTISLRSDGTLWLWGGIQTDAKGNLLSKRRSKPTLVAKSVVSFSSNGDSHAVVHSDGSLWAWGQNFDGELGIDPTSRPNDPITFLSYPTLVGTGYAKISIGSYRSTTIKSDGTLWEWGQSLRESATRNYQEAGYRRRSPAFEKKGEDFLQTDTNGPLSAAIKTDNTLWIWGTKEIYGDCKDDFHTDPIKVGEDYVSVAGGYSFVVAAKRDGSVWTWGWPWDGDQMELPQKCRKPVRVVFGDSASLWDRPIANTLKLALSEPKMPTNIVSIAAGGAHSAMVAADGTLWTWGDNSYGQLALGDFKNRLTPQKAGDGYKRVSIDDNLTYATKYDESLWRWGVLRERYTSRGEFERHYQAELQPTKMDVGITRFSRYGDGMLRVLGLQTNGDLLNFYFSTSTYAPTATNAHDVVEVAGGWSQSYLLKKDGTLWLTKGYVGEDKPRLVGKDFIHIVGAPYDDYPKSRAYGIKADGTLWAWGSNTLNQLGDGTNLDRDAPVLIGKGFVQVAAGRFHGIALGNDGTVWTWGNNEVGVIGDSTLSPATKLKKVGIGFSAIAAGDYHNLALKNDGTLWAWGSNEDGQLGDGTTQHRLTPTQVFPLPQIATQASSPTPKYPVSTSVDRMKDPVVSVRTGNEFSCALFTSGKIKCWGDNSDGIFGNGQRSSTNPVPLLIENTEKLSPYISSGFRKPAECVGAELQHCVQFRKDHPFLRDAKSMAGGCGLMPDSKIRCVLNPGDYDRISIVDELHDVVAFDASSGSSGRHGCALIVDGRVKCWGTNSHGQAGLRTTGHNNLLDSSLREVATEVNDLW
jgi:alpha-tubulin suppressor-like RCC1 family protein